MNINTYAPKVIPQKNPKKSQPGTSTITYPNITLENYEYNEYIPNTTTTFGASTLYSKSPIMAPL